MTPQPTSSSTWEDRARMADARRAAGADLDEVDLAALQRFPEPRTALAQQLAQREGTR